MDLKIKNMKEFSNMFFFELVIDDVLGVRGWKIRKDIDGNFELMLPQMKNKRNIYNDTSVLYDDDTYDRILELALKELVKLQGSNEVIE